MSVCRRSYDGYVKHKEIIQCAALGIPKGMKNAISISIAFCFDVLIINETITLEECKTKNRLK